MNAIDNFHKYTRNMCCCFLLIPGLLGVSGCQQTASRTNASSPKATQAYVPAPVISTAQSAPATNTADAGKPTTDTGVVSNCQRELVALSKINQRLYAQKKSAFEELLSSASVYTAVRGDITGQTRDTVDAFYKYKTQKICSDIEQSVRQSLITRMESFK